MTASTRQVDTLIRQLERAIAIGDHVAAVWLTQRLWRALWGPK